MAGECVIHNIVNAIDPTRIKTDQVWGNLSETDSNTKGVGVNEMGAEGGALAPAFDPSVSGDTDGCAIEARTFTTAREVMDSSRIGHIELEDFDLFDLDLTPCAVIVRKISMLLTVDD